MLPIPLAPADVTPAWLTAALSAGGLTEAAVLSVRAERIASLTSTMHRLHITYRHDEASLPPTLIWKQSSVDPGVRAAFGHYRGSAYEREVRFYRELAPSPRTRIPRCYVAEYDSDSDEHVLLLEDVALTHAAGDAVRGVSVTDAARCLHELALLHAAHWSGPRPTDSTDHSDGYRYFIESLDACREFLVELIGADAFTSLADASEVFGIWVGRLDAGPRTLIHADVHPGNVLLPVDDAGRAVLVDWQGWREGPPARDVGRWLVLGLTTTDRRRAERGLIAGYCAALGAHGVRYDEGEAYADYRIAAARQWIWAATFARRRDAWDATTRTAMPVLIRRAADAALDVLAGPGSPRSAPPGA
ncbi:MAG: phosphotransferase [Chloroflexi bacterium]|nr:phosphotransferase [Chloroflexota bacterium]MDA1004563.1 phosphotransferase [Chloroflexota bacterium]